MRDLSGTREIVLDGPLKRSIIRLARRFIKYCDADTLETRTYRVENLWRDLFSYHAALGVTDKRTGNVYDVEYVWDFACGPVLKVGAVEVYLTRRSSE